MMVVVVVVVVVMAKLLMMMVIIIMMMMMTIIIIVIIIIMIESGIVASQDQALNTKYYATKILHTETESKCRLCQQFDETIDHIISACKRTVCKTA
jgi:hypothetical protein